MLEHVVFEPHPQLPRLVESRRLRRRVREAERVGVRPIRDIRSTPYRVIAPHQVPAVEVVVRIDVGPRLVLRRDALVEPPPVVARNLHEPGAVDVHSGDRGEASRRVQHDREVLVVELDGCRSPRLRHARHRGIHAQESCVESRDRLHQLPADRRWIRGCFQVHDDLL
jgi:hypothetical protein